MNMVPTPTPTVIHQPPLNRLLVDTLTLAVGFDPERDTLFWVHPAGAGTFTRHLGAFPPLDVLAYIPEPFEILTQWDDPNGRWLYTMPPESAELFRFLDHPGYHDELIAGMTLQSTQ
jgi:hypothetical protein